MERALSTGTTAAIANLRGRWSSLRLRDKLVSFYTVMIIIIVGINATTSYTAVSSMRVFNQNLISYFNIHQLQLTLEVTRDSLDHYLREKSAADLSTYYELVPRVWQLMETVQSESNTSLEATFQLRATRRGLEAYFRAGNTAIQKRVSGAGDYYASYVRAARIENYVEGYISLLLNIQLTEGSRSYQMLMHRASTVRLISFGALLALGALSILFGIMFSNYVSGPVGRLAELASRIASGDLDVDDMRVDSRDEIGILAASFNSMSSSIRDLVTDLRDKAELEKRLHEEELTIVRMEQSLREAQFLGLQSQINPHFLFNTLNTIARTAQFERAEQTSRLIQSLARVFRYNLRDANKTVTLKEEIAILNEYLAIQKHRYGDRLEFVFRCTVDTERVIVPCFTLQPLVENSLKYAVEPLEEGGRVEVDIFRRAGEVRISIRDNGPGMNPQTVKALLDGESTGQTTGIGIPNVANRLKLLYRGRERFSIRSNSARGTVITIAIPQEAEAVDVIPAAHS